MFASTTLIGSEHPGVVLRLAAAKRRRNEQTLEQIDRVLGLVGRRRWFTTTPRRNLSRRVRVDDGRLAGVRLAGDLAAEAWMRDFFLSGASVAELRQRLAGSAGTALGASCRAARWSATVSTWRRARSHRICAGLCLATLRAKLGALQADEEMRHQLRVLSAGTADAVVAVAARERCRLCRLARNCRNSSLESRIRLGHKSKKR